MKYFKKVTIFDMMLSVIELKKKIFYLFFLVLTIITITGCAKENTSEKDKKSKESEENIVEEINEGTIDGYNFKVTEEQTDRVKIQMNNGDIMLVVLSNKDTPITIANFKKLVSEHFYDGLTFHRVVSDFMIQGGDPEGTGMGGSKDTIKGEFNSNGVKNSLSHTRGVISMARSNNPNSASSQFFIMHSDTYKSSLDGNYAAFGRVFAGLDVIDKIASIEVNGETPVNPPVIKSIKFITVEKA